ncbi:MAG: hypothetical protein IIA07_12975 [Proteobacteria bacterium]|nr:hypothetical protein [Pseudomonadota bacterium]
MDVESISGAATVALTSTFIFVLIAKSWQLVIRVIGSNPSFSDSIMRESAQRFRDEFERLNSEQSTFLSAVVVFAVLFAAAYVLNAERLFVGYPYWQLYILLAALSAGALLAAYRLTRTVRARRHVKLRRDANIAVGHELQRMATILGRTYHDVETSAGIIDHIVVGQNGAYAINVVARRSVRNGNVELRGKELHFAPVNKTHSIVATSAMIASLEREFRRLLDHRVRVRSVIAIPGWEIAEQSSDEHLLVNERNLPMLGGWKDQADFLLNEDVDALHKLLTSRCRLMPVGK